MLLYEILDNAPLSGLHVVYHVAEMKHKDAIVQHGIKAASRDDLHPENNYSGRVYVFVKLDKDYIMDYMGEIFSRRYHKRLPGERDWMLVPYSVFQIDVTKIPDAKFYKDPWTSSDMGAYTTSDIPASVIAVAYDEKTDHRQELGLKT